MVAIMLDLIEEFAKHKFTFKENRQFSYLDSAILYGMIKKYEPKKIVEVGCGYSTKIINQAFDGELICIDPEPRTDIEGLPTLFLVQPAQTVGKEVYVDADLLFIDSSHVVYQGGELVYLFFEILPALKKGVLVHFHDIFLPDDYPPAWKPRRYNEQYFLSAYLKGNEDWKAIWKGYEMATRYKAEIDTAFGNSVAGSYWIQKCQ